MSEFAYHAGCFTRNGQMVATLTPSSNAEDRVTPLEDGVFRVERVFSVKEGQAAPSELRLEVLTAFAPVFYEIPCVTYNGNRWGSGVEPQGLTVNGKPWVYASHRASVPGCTYSEGEGETVCLFGDPANPPFSMSMEPIEGRMAHRLLLPEREGPMRYCAKAAYDAPLQPALFLNGRIALTAYVALAPQAERGQAIARTMAFAHRRWQREQTPRFDANALWRLGIRFARESVYFEDQDFRGFCMGLYYDAGAWVQRRNHLEIGWVGQNASLAVALLADGLQRGDQSEVAQATGVLDAWLACRLSNGLFRCRYDRMQANGGNLHAEDEPIDAANLFSVARHYLRAYRLLAAHDVVRDDYRDTALAVCRFGLCAQQADGSFAKAWYADGALYDAQGTVGAYMAWALLYAYHETDDDAYLLAAKRGFAFYDALFRRDGYMTAGALDTYCIDKESAMPMLALSVELAEITGEPYWTERAIAISNYLDTWLYHYSVTFPSRSLLAQYRYETLGATAVSVQHQHVDAYALQMLRYWLRLSRLTADDAWAQRAWMIWCNATQFVSDGTLVIDGVARPAGSQDEGVCQTLWHTGRGEPFHTSRWLVCWNDAFRLENLLDAEVRGMLAQHGNPSAVGIRCV